MEQQRAPLAKADGTTRTTAMWAEIVELEHSLGEDPERGLLRAVEIEQDALSLGDEALAQRARLHQADIAERGGDVAAAIKVMWQVNEWATERGNQALLSRSHMLMCRGYNDVGDLSSALEHALAAVEHLDDDTSRPMHVMTIMRLADTFAETGSLVQARERYAQALAAATPLDDLKWLMTVLNNSAYCEHRVGDPQRAWAAVQRLLAASEAHDSPLHPSALDTMARVQIDLGEYEAAQRTAQQAVDGVRAAGSEQAIALPEVLLTLAVTRLRLRLLEETQDGLDEVFRLCREHGLEQVRVQTLLEQAHLFAAAGEYEPAYRAFETFHDAERQWTSVRREAQAHMQQALFEVAEARREAEQFREQARRDPLTGLRNRRFVEERLPALLNEVVNGERGPIVTALLDLDNFKRVNDECSHEVGDLVLVALAQLLQSAPLGASGFAARLGGEEFLLVLTESDVQHGTAVLDQLRRTIQDHPWEPLTGQVPVTTSMGVAVADRLIDQSALLSAADSALYRAKAQGRNRLVIAAPVAFTDRRRNRSTGTRPV